MPVSPSYPSFPALITTTPPRSSNSVKKTSITFPCKESFAKPRFCQIEQINNENQVGSYTPEVKTNTTRPVGMSSTTALIISQVASTTADNGRSEAQVSPVIVLIKKFWILRRYKFAREATPSSRAPATQATKIQESVGFRMPNYWVKLRNSGIVTCLLCHALGHTLLGGYHQ